MKKKVSLKLPHYSFHHLVMEASFWGTMTRVLLIAFIALAVGLLQVLDTLATTDTNLVESVLKEGQLFVYIVGTFLIFDSGYIIIARKYGFTQLLDKVILLTIETILALSYFLPYFVIFSELFTYISRWTFVAVLGALAARLLIGILYGSPLRK